MLLYDPERGLMVDPDALPGDTGLGAPPAPPVPPAEAPPAEAPVAPPGVAPAVEAPYGAGTAVQPPWAAPGAATATYAAPLEMPGAAPQGLTTGEKIGLFLAGLGDVGRGLGSLSKTKFRNVAPAAETAQARQFLLQGPQRRAAEASQAQQAAIQKYQMGRQQEADARAAAMDDPSSELSRQAQRTYANVFKQIDPDVTAEEIAMIPASAMGSRLSLQNTVYQARAARALQAKELEKAELDRSTMQDAVAQQYAQYGIEVPQGTPISTLKFLAGAGKDRFTAAEAMKRANVHASALRGSSPVVLGGGAAPVTGGATDTGADPYTSIDIKSINAERASLRRQLAEATTKNDSQRIQIIKENMDALDSRAQEARFLSSTYNGYRPTEGTLADSTAPSKVTVVSKAYGDYKEALGAMKEAVADYEGASWFKKGLGWSGFPVDVQTQLKTAAHKLAVSEAIINGQGALGNEEAVRTVEAQGRPDEILNLVTGQPDVALGRMEKTADSQFKRVMTETFQMEPAKKKPSGGGSGGRGSKGGGQTEEFEGELWMKEQGLL